MTTEPTTLYFVRHGESEGNAARLFTGQLDSPLTALGRKQAESVAEALTGIHIDRVVSSDLSRTRDTAAVIAVRHGLSVDTFPELREIDVGSAQGRSYDEIRGLPEWNDEGFVQWPGGESLDDVLKRALRLIRQLVAEAIGETIVIVGHGGVTRILVSHFLGLLPNLEQTRGGNTSITRVLADGESFKVEALFDTAHLPPPSPEAMKPLPDAENPR